MDFWLSHTEALATVLSVIAVLTTAVIGYRAQWRRHRREYTLSVLSHSITNPEIMKGKNIIRRLQSAGEQIDSAKLSKEEMDDVVNTVNYYEFIGNAFVNRDLEVKIVLDQLAGSFLLTYDCALNYIEKRRRERGRDKTYRGLQKMVEHIRKQER